MPNFMLLRGVYEAVFLIGVKSCELPLLGSKLLEYWPGSVYLYLAGTSLEFKYVFMFVDFILLLY